MCQRGFNLARLRNAPFFFFFFLLLFATPQLLGMLTFFLCHLRAQPGLKFFLPQTHHIFIIFQAKEVHIQRC